jgi:nicotinamidase-related amidase
MALDIEMFDPDSTALLVMDHQNMLVQGIMSNPEGHLAKVAGVIAKARTAGLSIIYVQKSFRPGYPEVHDNNLIFSGVRAGSRLLESDELTQIPDTIAPQKGDIVVRGHRISAFEGTDLSVVLRSGKIDTLVMFGIATSGVVLSTVRQGGDLDYRMVVLRDLCGDNDEKVHEFLLDAIIPRQAAVVDSDDFMSN